MLECRLQFTPVISSRSLAFPGKSSTSSLRYAWHANSGHFGPSIEHVLQVWTNIIHDGPKAVRAWKTEPGATGAIHVQSVRYSQSEGPAAVPQVHQGTGKSALHGLANGTPPLKCIWPGPRLRLPRPLYDPLAGPWQTRGSVPGHSYTAFMCTSACLAHLLAVQSRSWWLCKRRPRATAGQLRRPRPVSVERRSLCLSGPDQVHRSFKLHRRGCHERTLK